MVAYILRSNVRRIDMVARYGGGEFAILMPGASLAGVRNLFERVRAEVAEQPRLTLGLVKTQLGAARFPDDTDDPLDLLETADEAMYQAKHQGKDRIFAMLSGLGS